MMQQGRSSSWWSTWKDVGAPPKDIPGLVPVDSDDEEESDKTMPQERPSEASQSDSDSERDGDCGRTALSQHHADCVKLRAARAAAWWQTWQQVSGTHKCKNSGIQQEEVAASMADLEPSADLGDIDESPNEEREEKQSADTPVEELPSLSKELPCLSLHSGEKEQPSQDATEASFQ